MEFKLPEAIELDDSVKEQITGAVKEFVSGLERKKDELLAEKKKIQEKLKALPISDPEKISELQSRLRELEKFFKDNEYAQLLKDGKFDTVLEMKTQELQEQLEEYKSKIHEKDNAVTQLQSEIKRMKISDALRAEAAKAGVLPEAIDDVLLRGLSTFTLGEGDTIYIADEDGKPLKDDDGKIVTVKKWITTLPKHYFPADTHVNIDFGNQSDVMERLSEAAKSGDLATYKQLREKMKHA